MRLALLALAGCSAGSTFVEEAASRTRLIGVPATVQVDIDAGGDFSPSTVAIEVNDAVQWTGVGVRDNVARVADAPGEVCDTPAEWGTVIDEFTGPVITSPGGLWVRGPTNTAGGPEIVTAPTTCDNDLNPIVVGTKSWCENQDGIPMVIPNEVVQYQEVDGGLTVLKWDEVETADQTFDWTTLDLELDQWAAASKNLSYAMRSGQGSSPAWMFTGAGGTVTAVALEGVNDNDFGDDPENCGTDWNAGSIADAEYLEEIEEFIVAFCDHVKSDTLWKQTLASVILVGFNATTDEFKTMNTCPDDWTGDPQSGGTLGADGILDTYGGDACKCNTKTWANAGYTPDLLLSFVEDQIQLWHDECWPELVVRVPLIQGGYPRAVSPTNFLGDALLDTDGVTPLLVGGTTADDWQLTASGTQTTNIVDTIYAGGEESRAAQAQHFGLGCLPQEESTCGNTDSAECSYQAATVTSEFCTFPLDLVGPITATETGCPNRWANTVTLEPPRPRMSGFQTNNRNTGVDSPAALESALFNLTCNTNAPYFETYAETVFEAHEESAGGDMNPDRTIPDAETDPDLAYTHTLVEWSSELKRRRDYSVYSSLYGEAKPDSFSFRFTQPEAHRYTNGRTCQDGTGTEATITVSGVGTSPPPSGNTAESVTSDTFTRWYLWRGDGDTATDAIVWLHGGHDGGEVTDEATTHMGRITERAGIIDITPQAYPGSSGWYLQDPPDDFGTQTLPGGWSGNEDVQFLGVDLITDIETLFPTVERIFLVGYSHGAAMVLSAIENGWPGGATPYDGYGIVKNTLFESQVVGGQFTREHDKPLAWYVALDDPKVQMPPVHQFHLTYADTYDAVLAEFGGTLSGTTTSDCCGKSVEVFEHGATPFRWHEEDSASHGWTRCQQPCSVDAYMVDFFTDHAGLGT